MAKLRYNAAKRRADPDLKNRGCRLKQREAEQCTERAEASDNRHRAYILRKVLRQNLAKEQAKDRNNNRRRDGCR